MNTISGTDRRLYRSIARGEESPEFWVSIDPESMARLRAVAHGRFFPTATIAGLAFAAAVVVLLAYDSLVSLVLLAVCCAAFFRAARASIVMRKLAPVAESENACASIVKWESTSAVRAFRDQVVGGGRELVLGDFEVMERLERRFGEATQRRHALCRQAHGLQPQAPAPGPEAVT